MLVVYKSGPRAGKTSHVPRTPEIECLLEAGIIEQVQEYVPPAKVSWTVGIGEMTQRIFLTGRCSREVCGTFRFEGTAEQAKRCQFLHSCGKGAMPEAIPLDVINRYAAAKNEEQIVITDDVANYYQTLNCKGEKPREVEHGKDIGYKHPWEKK